MRLSLPRHAELWLPGLVRSKLGARPRSADYGGPLDIIFCLADHYEPGHRQAHETVERARVHAWLERYPRLAEKFSDFNGRPPQHTFFFPAEGYRPELLDPLAELRRLGFGDVEVHLHHHADTADGLRARLGEFTEALHHRHGLLRRDGEGRIVFGFIHGNWALDNARPDGKWCGVNNEISVLREAGCYADFTLPAAPDPSQTRTVNSIYYATDDPLRPRSHEFGVTARVGQRAPENGLLIIQGPLTFDWNRRIWRLFPGLDNSAIDASSGHLPTLERFAAWVDVGIAVAGRPEWIFVKVHTHGAVEENASVLLGPVMERFHAEVTRRFNDGGRYRLHYVTAFEMAGLVKAAEAGETSTPSELLGRLRH
jgi:hypothetical protein